MPQRVLITGSEGLVGSVLRRGLQGYELLRLDRLELAAPDYARADIVDEEGLQAVLASLPPLDAVVHLAGDPRIDAPWESVLPNNIVGTRNVYEAARRHGVARVVFASTTHVTGLYEGLPPALHLQPRIDRQIPPEAPVAPDGYYGASKAFGEALARYFAEAFGMRMICLRMGHVNRQDDPKADETGRARSIWLSHRDLVQLVDRSLRADVRFGIYYGISNNARRFWDITNARRDLGYEPVDDAEDWFG